jgi:hypothetical protein
MRKTALREETKMKEFRKVRHIGLLIFVVSLLSGGGCQQPAMTRSIASMEEMNLLRARDTKTLASAKDPVLVSPSASGAPLLPDLLVKSISVTPALSGPIESGSSFTVLTKIQNKGKIQADSESIEQYYLSADKVYSGGDILLVGSRTVPIIDPKQYSEGSTEVSIPASTPSGQYYVISCADDTKDIAEKNEMNNCKAAKRKIQVTNANVPILIPINYDLQVTQGVSTDVSFPVNPGPGSYTNISLNLQDILTNSVTIQTPAPTPGVAANNISAAALLTMNMYIRIGASASTVCQDGLRYGPFLIAGDSSAPTANPPSATAEPSSVNIIDSGSFAMCIQVVSDTDASIHVGDTTADATQCNQPPENLSGTWTGTYTCLNQGSPDEIDLPITLTITQDGYRAQYIDDGGDAYEGTVCGSVFKFNRTSPLDFSTESGKFVLNTDGSGTKTSTWRSVSSPNTNWGTCTDNLHRL